MIKLSGFFFFLASLTVIMGIVTAEIFYPGYSISKNMISTLGASPPPDSVIKEPSGIIFDSIMLAAGVLTLFGTYFLSLAKKEKVATLFFALMGLGTLGVGAFPAFHPYAHPFSALIAFAAGGIAALLSARITEAPFRHLALILGIITLFVLMLGLFLPGSIVPILGVGGTERWIAYPLMLWLSGFGGYFMNTKTK